jgi:hypothetical protein
MIHNKHEQTRDNIQGFQISKGQQKTACNLQSPVYLANITKQAITRQMKEKERFTEHPFSIPHIKPYM